MDLEVKVIRESELTKTLSRAKDAQLESVSGLFGVDYDAYDNREALIKTLVDVLVDETALEEVLFQLDQDELELYMRLGKKVIDNIPEFEFEYVLGLMNSGLMYPGVLEELVFANSIWDTANTILTDEYMNLFGLYDEIENYAVSMVNLFGIVHVNFFITIYKAFHSEECVDRKILFKLKKVIDEHFVEYQDGFIFSREIGTHFEDVYEEIKSKSWYVPEKEELLKYISFDYYEETMFTDGVWELLDERTNAANPEDVLVFMQQDIRINGFDGDLINHVIENFELEFNSEDDLHEFVGLVAEMANHTRQWLNLGYKPVELFSEVETA
jgi:hypothetical protein